MAEISTTAPVAAIGYTQAPTQQWWLYENETTPELQWPQSVYVFDQMRRTDSQCRAVLKAVMLPVLRTPWRIDPAGARPEVAQLVADDLGLPIVGQPMAVPARQRDRFSWTEHVRLALLSLVFGHSFFEQVYRVDGDGSMAHLAKLEYRPPTSIERIDVAKDGGLVAIKQYWTDVDRTPQPIPASRLVAYVNEREGGNWLGTSLLRAAYKNWLLKDRLLRVQAQTIERNGMGIPIYEGAENEASLASGLGMATSLRSGEAAGAATPFGAKLRLMGVEGTLPDAKPAIDYHDDAIARAVLAHFLNLGTQTGSWALGSTFADFFTLSLQTVAQFLADTATDHIVEDLVDVNWGPDEPAPRLCFDEIGSRQQATAEALSSLVQSGILHPDATLEGATRQFYGLPPADPGTETPAPEDLGGSGSGDVGSEEPTPTGTYSVAAKRGRRPVRAKFDPEQVRDDHGRWSLVGAAVKALGDALGSDVKLHEDFGDGHSGGLVALHEDGRISIGAHGTGGAKPKVELSDSEAEDLGYALEDDAPGEESGEGWHLKRDATGATLYGQHDDSGMRLTSDEKDQLAEALSEVHSRASNSDDLTAVKPLRPGESLVGKKEFATRGDDPLGVAIVDGPAGRSVRLAPIRGLDPNGENPLKAYTGGEGQSSALLDRDSAARLTASLQALAAESEVRRRHIDNAFDQIESEGLTKADGSWTEAAHARFGELLGEHYSSGVGYNGHLDADGVWGEPTEIATPWGTVVLQGASNEVGDWTIYLGVRPARSSSEDFDIEDYETPKGDLEPKDVKALIKYLSTAFPAAVAAARPTAVLFDEAAWIAAAAGLDTHPGGEQLKEIFELVQAAAGHDTTPGHDQLHHYWTKDPEGLAKWVDSPHPWTTLVAHLTKYVGPLKAKVFASRWFIEVFGYAAGSDKNRVAHGNKPRGKVVGPG